MVYKLVYKSTKPPYPHSACCLEKVIWFILGLLQVDEWMMMQVAQ